MRYILFSGENYYPAGGAYDISGQSDKIQDLYALIRVMTKSDYGPIDPLHPHFVTAFEGSWAGIDWWHIYDTTKREIVCEDDDCDLTVFEEYHELKELEEEDE